MRRGDISVGSVLVLGSLYLYRVSMGFPAGRGHIPGPGLFPRLVLGALLILGVATLWRGLRGGAGSVAGQDWRAIGTVLLNIVLVTLYVVVVQAGWFVYVTPVFLVLAAALLLKVQGRTVHYGALIGLSLVLTAGLYVAFIKVLQVPII